MYQYSLYSTNTCKVPAGQEVKAIRDIWYTE